jgi:plasmid replication initiation protein
VLWYHKQFCFSASKRNSVEAQDTVSKTEQLRETTEKEKLRKVKKETRLDHVTHQDITQQCGIQSIGE